MSSLLEELNKNKAIEDAVQPNKMSKFAYTEKAYNDNDASGVDSFDFEAEQNIPSNKLTVLQTNETIILKGFRAQASSVTRQLLNHFFGRASYNLNKVHDVVKGVLDAFVNFIGKANGIATLDENGRIPYSQLPESAMEFKGTWDASNNTPTLVDGTGDTGDFYVVSVAGTQNLGSGEIKFLENDRVIYSEGVWSKLSAGDVRTINNIQPTDGNVTLTGDDINISASDATKVSTKVTSHIDATTDVHGATSEATASKLIIRDSAGRAQVASPSEDNDITNKAYVDALVSGDAGAVQQALNEHIAKTTEVHGATSEATANKIAIRDDSGRLQVATPSAANDATTKDYVDKLSLTLIEKRVITESGNVSIPEGTKLITYIGIGGGGGGGSAGEGMLMNPGGNGGGGGSGAAGEATPGSGGGAGTSIGTGKVGTKGGNGGNGESGIIWNVKSLKVTAHIGLGGTPGYAGTHTGANGGDTYVSTESTEELVTHIKNVSPNTIKGNDGKSGNSGCFGGQAVGIFEVQAGQGGKGGQGTNLMNPASGEVGKNGAIIMFFYK